ncbi:MAG TPA: TauD/TfdA family dioxygenase [Alphaproteobacteria bacterium]|nr:TauD/TfdA family dioxygenase [Alphaproteobacteria bacterium]
MTTLSDRLSQPVQDSSAWYGPQMLQRDDWIVRLSPPELAELDKATAAVRAKGLSPLEVTREDFLLPTLAPKIDNWVEELENGRGFQLIKGIPVERYDQDTLATLYWGIGTHLGQMISQNAKGELLARVEDTGADFAAKNARGYRTNAGLHPHNDSADLVGLLCVRQALEGGLSSFTSSMTIFNEILQQRPDLLPPLWRGFHYDVRGEGVTADPNEVTRHPVPVFSYYGGRLSCRFNARAIRTGAEKMGSGLSGLDAEAVEMVERLSTDPRLRLDMALEPGDLQILNNHMTIHMRSAFRDTPEHKRLLLRLWVNLWNGRPLAPEFANRYNTGAREGVARGAG